MTTPLPFADRTEAGRALAARLAGYTDPLVLGVPRGGVEVAAPIAEALGGELDLLLTRKVGAPLEPELAVGAITPDGQAIFNLLLLRRLGLAPEGLEPEVSAARRELERRWREYRGERPLPAVRGRTVITVDDGIATGFTLRAGLAWIRRLQPEKLVIAVPVAPAEVWGEVAAEADEAVCLANPEPFYAVGQFYVDFAPVDDRRVIELLQANWRRRT
ncbi:MAG: phosphoribosyltransferase family protein [Clostridia bacterium]|nr:phosphoribosyltransferase family protein [Clostridia bacterium]MDH7573387.1 phosphoribosyltransferase family protein [Clostridia bacterium]